MALIALALALALGAAAILPEDEASALDQGKLVQPGRLVVAGRKLSTVIMLNMQALNGLPRPVQWLIYYHECGHILYGPSETAADCYAVRRARREGWLNEKALDDICAVFNIAGHGPVHPDPEQRCNDLRQCFSKKSGITAQDDGR